MDPAHVHGHLGVISIAWPARVERLVATRPCGTRGDGVCRGPARGHSRNPLRDPLLARTSAAGSRQAPTAASAYSGLGRIPSWTAGSHGRRDVPGRLPGAPSIGRNRRNRGRHPGAPGAIRRAACRRPGLAGRLAATCRLRDPWDRPGVQHSGTAPARCRRHCAVGRHCRGDNRSKPSRGPQRCSS
jgi:hypothetical protein